MYEELFIDHLDVYVYSRSFKGQRLLVITNFSNKEVQLNIGERLKEIVLGNYEDTLLLNGNVTVRPYECMVYELD
ncbi:cyclomaltodextrinase C-terminal domain-containing protein [Anaerobacillus arseniciselenatis]|uniref:cyclomaltodextrinase C-terminal domain-containing protein n=1 Tax=Anaerobacillus arseniciselenatis TaxID=85682 RepID=UPI0030811E20